MSDSAKTESSKCTTCNAEHIPNAPELCIANLQRLRDGYVEKINEQNEKLALWDKSTFALADQIFELRNGIRSIRDIVNGTSMYSTSGLVDDVREKVKELLKGFEQ